MSGVRGGGFPDSGRAIVAAASEQAVAVAFSLIIPVVGTALGQLVLGAKSQLRIRRAESFKLEFSERLQALREDTLDRDYAHSEEYVEFVVRAAEIAAKSHRRAKIVLLAEVAVGAARSGWTNVWRDKFLLAADVVSPEHVAVLRAMDEKEAWLRKPEGAAGRTLSEVVGEDYTLDELELMLRDLATLGFVEDSGMGRYDVTSGQAWKPTLVGQRFLSFLVSKPQSEQSPKSTKPSSRKG